MLVLIGCILLHLQDIQAQNALNKAMSECAEGPSLSLYCSDPFFTQTLIHRELMQAVFFSIHYSITLNSNTTSRYITLVAIKLLKLAKMRCQCIYLCTYLEIQMENPW